MGVMGKRRRLFSAFSIGCAVLAASPSWAAVVQPGGGVAFGDVIVNTTTNWQSADKTGWTAGAGLEGAFTDHWTARVEYLFVDLTNSTFTPVVGTNITTKFNANLIRVGVEF
jgi:opacity protein-like surface antigen